MADVLEEQREAYLDFAARRRRNGSHVPSFEVFQRRSLRAAEMAAAVAAERDAIFEDGKKVGEEIARAAQPAPEPSRKSGFDWTEYRRRHLGDPGVELPVRALSESTIAAARQHAERIEATRIDFKTETDPAKLEAQLRRMGVDGVLIGDLGLRPPTPERQPEPERKAPTKLSDVMRDPRKLSERQRAEIGFVNGLREEEAARAELAAAREAAKATGGRIDAMKLKPAALALYYKAMGWDLRK
jgi:hypothetical protein